MLPLLRSWPRVASGVAAVLLMLGISSAAEAQSTCPINAACTPGSASVSNPSLYGMAILNVTVGTNVLANRTTYLAGYHDYSCTQNAALVVGQSYPISVRTTATAAQNVRVWIDYNNDGAFTGNNELVFSSDNATTHSGTFVVPATATLTARLRMRVATDYANSPIPTSCSTPVYSQDEDYSVTLSANASPPVAAFTTSATTTCTGCVQFTDASQNVPTAWLWTFGDGQTSNVQNPNHCYTAAGTYAVTLRATNAAGNSTTAATSITYNTQVPVAATCTPSTINYFGNYGITRFRLGTIDNTSADGSAGYQNFTCTQRAELMVGLSTQMIITTGGTNAHDIRVYLDSNNNGTFDSGEQIYQSLNTLSPGATANITLPGTITLNQPLRLRVIADAVGNTITPCANQASGQAEDYTIIARPNTSPPTNVGFFTSNYVPGGCVNPVQFTDASQNAPTSWLWNFGDGTTSTAQNPSHQYTTAGTYTVSLTATNANGSATGTRLNYITIQIPCFNYCAANGFGGFGPGGTTLASPFYITSVVVNNGQPTYNNTTNIATGGYGNYTAFPITMGAGRTVSLTVTTNLAAAHSTWVWVDYNTNGVFATNELLVNGISSAGPNSATYTTSFTVPSPTAGLSARMRVMVAVNSNTPNACAVNLQNAEVEDYQLVFGPLASRQEQALPSLSLYPTPTPDGRVHLRLPDAGAAGTYAATVQNLLGATLLSTSLRLGPADAELDLSRLSPGVYLLQLRDAKGQTAVRRVVRE